MLALGVAGGGLFVTVEDPGVGIVADDLGRVTEPFAQAAGPLTRGHEGTGPGLALVKSFVELHDGTLEIESEPGKGTRVTVRFSKERTLTPQAVKTPDQENVVNE